MEGLRKATKDVIQCNWSSGRDFNPRSTEYGAGPLIIYNRQRLGIVCLNPIKVVCFYAFFCFALPRVGRDFAVQSIPSNV
jgi:hypothetical protein